MISSSSRRVVRGEEGTDVLRGEREEKNEKDLELLLLLLPVILPLFIT